MFTVQDLLDLPPVPAAARVAYGPSPSQFADLYLPDRPGPHVAVVLIHGGCWQARYDLAHLSPLAGAVAAAGFAVWNLEYRRLGEPGGGWPGTFRDVSQALNRLRQAAQTHYPAAERVVLVGHSAGGHLALWLAAHAQGAGEGVLDPAHLDLPHVLGVIALAGIADLAVGLAQQVCADAIAELMGGTPAQLPERYRRASPAAMLPLGVPQVLICGSGDEIVPPAYVAGYAEAAAQCGDDVDCRIVAGWGHYEPVIPHGEQWQIVLDALVGLSSRGGS